MLKRLLLLLGLGLALLGPATPLLAKEAPSAAANPEVEKRMMVLAAELRCLVCQNQTIADSHASLAEDLRQQVREMIQQGKTDDEIRDFMTQRYGDFVLYKPPFKAQTALLWIGPALLMALAVGTLIVVLRRRQRLSDDAFDPETDPNLEADERERAPDAHR
jgi:cytochrome c-type biogenesis protein CcmH